MPFASSTDATVATVRAPSPSGFGVRLVSALILIPVALVEVVLGSPYFDVLVGLAGALIAWEWARLVGGGRLVPAGVVGIAAVLAATIGYSFLPAGWTFGVVVLGAVLTAAAAALRGGKPLWLGLGVLYAGLPCIAVLWLRAAPPAGLATLLWLFALVWATDTGAYFAGRTIGGPKLMPSVSPKKTWAGLAGGIVAAAAVGVVSGLLIDGASPVFVAVASAVLAVVAQAGDLAESALKRHFGAKDSSRIIPGHGGVMDRVDGLVTVVLAVALASGLAGRTVVAW